MSDAVVLAPDRTPGNRGRAVSVTRARSLFYSVLSGVVLLIVLAGFSRTLYLRSLFDVPAIPAYIMRWPVFEGVNVDAFNLGALSLLIGALVVHDLVSNRRIHPVTLIGGACFLVTRVFAQFVSRHRTPA